MTVLSATSVFCWSSLITSTDLGTHLFKSFTFFHDFPVFLIINNIFDLNATLNFILTDQKTSFELIEPSKKARNVFLKV